MNIELSTGLDYFWQWDTNTKLKIPDEIPEAHFRFDNKVATIEVEDGWVKIPDELMQKRQEIEVWTYDKEHTMDFGRIECRRRPKPDTYVYTPTEVKRWDDLDERIKALEENNTAVLYTEQELTEEQKAQARENIGAVNEEDLVQADWAQSDETAKDYVKNRIAYWDYPKVFGNVLWNGLIGFEPLKPKDYLSAWVDRPSDITVNDFIKRTFVMVYKGEKLEATYACNRFDTWTWPVATDGLLLTMEWRNSEFYFNAYNSSDETISMKYGDLYFTLATPVTLQSGLLPLATETTPGAIQLPYPHTRDTTWKQLDIKWSGTADSLNLFVNSPINGATSNVLSKSLLLSTLCSVEGNTVICGSGDDTVSTLRLATEDYPVVITHTSHVYGGNTPIFYYLISTATGKKGSFSQHPNNASPSAITWSFDPTSSSSSIFIIHVLTHDWYADLQFTSTIDKTYDEILAAYNEGRDIVFSTGSSYQPLVSYDGYGFYFEETISSAPPFVDIYFYYITSDFCGGHYIGQVTFGAVSGSAVGKIPRVAEEQDGTPTQWEWVDYGGMFAINITYDSTNETYSADKTYDEIVSARDSGLIPVCKMQRDIISSYAYGYCYYTEEVKPPIGANSLIFQNIVTGGENYQHHVTVSISSSNCVEAISRSPTMSYDKNSGRVTTGYVPNSSVLTLNYFLRGDATWQPVLQPPSTASVGQYLSVKSVDDNGVVSEVEAVDAPSGSAGPTVHIDMTTDEELAWIFLDGFNTYSINVLVYFTAPSSIGNGNLYVYPMSDNNVNPNFYVYGDSQKVSGTRGYMYRMRSIKDGFLQCDYSSSPWGAEPVAENASMIAVTASRAGTAWVHAPITKLKICLSFGSVNLPAGTRVIVWED